MAEEAKDTEVLETVEEENPTSGGEAMSTILSAVKTNPELANDPEIAAVLKMASGEKGDTTAKEETVVAEKDNKETETEKEAVKEEEVTEDSEEDTNKEVADSNFYKKTEKADKDNKADFSNLDEALEHIKDKYSIDDLGTFFNSADKWRKGAQDIDETQEKFDDIQNAFSELPEPLFNAFQAWANGQDWTEEVQNAGLLDYKSDFEDYETYDIVNYYFPDEYEEDDFTENSDDATVKRAVKLARKQYEAEQESFEDQRAEYMRKGENLQKVLKSSTGSSVDKLRESFPDFSKDALKKVKDTMISGDLTSLFFNKDGSYTDDAAEKVALMLYGRDEIIKANNRTKKSQEVLKTSVAKGSEKPSVKTTQSQQTQVPEEVTGIFKDVFEKRYY
tara:strand:+ start:10118 stop:11290 length:1173 start_codon:yes stop_codon:yes gene_type:complete